MEEFTYEWTGTDDELIDTIDEIAGNIVSDIGEPMNEKEARKLFLDALSRHEIQSLLTSAMISILENERGGVQR